MQSKFKVEIYGFDVEVVIVDDENKTGEFYKDLRKKLKKKPKKLGTCQGFVYLSGFKAWIVFAKNHLSYNLITHECAHLTFKILNFNNIEVKKDNEYFACLTGYVNEQVFKIINKTGWTIL